LCDKRLGERESARALEVIRSSARAQNQLISDLLDVSRIITGKSRLEMRVVELPPIIEAAMDVVRPTAEAKKIRLVSALDSMAGPVSGDSDRLQQIAWNLLSNAVKFTPAGGQVTVSLEREGASVKLTVSDTGEGIEPEFLPFVFDRFRQFESTPARAHGGLGLGLAIARHLVELHGGTISVASRGRGQGATFTVTLPPAFPKESGEHGHLAGAGGIPQSQALSPDCLRNLRVLVVDDEPAVRDLISLAFTSYGAEVRDCASATEAIQILDEWQPDALVFDLGMPDEDGYELMRKVRAREPERGGRIPAIALTEYARAEDVARKVILSEGRRVLWCLATSLFTALTGALRDAQPVHQHLPHIVVHIVDVRVGPFGGVDRVVEPGGGEQRRPAGGHGVDRAERAFLHAGSDDCRGQPDQLVEVGRNDGLGVGRQRPIGGEQLRVFGGPAAFDINQGVEELP